MATGGYRAGGGIDSAGGVVRIRRMLLTPLAKIIAHIREIAGGNLANTLTIDGRSEMGDLAQSVSHMQRSLTDTVTHVREGSDAIYAGTREIAAGNTRSFLPY